MATREGLSVVVPTRDRPDHLRTCVAALVADLGPQDELIVVDSASQVPVTTTDGRVLRCDLPGASRARNAGWRAARHALVAFVDDDVQVTPGWADALVAGFAPEVAFVTGSVVIPVGQEDQEFPQALTTRTEAVALTERTRGTVGATANMAVRSSALVDVGGFDERLGPGTPACAAEDLDLLDRLFARGRQGWFAPDARAVHDQWRTRAEVRRLTYGYGIGLGVRLVLLSRRGQWRRAKEVATDALLKGTLWEGLRDLRKDYRFGMLIAAVRLLGVFRGLLRGVLLR